MTIEELIAQAESGLTAQFARIDRMEEIGTRRVLDAFREHQVAYRHFAPTTGYGYDDVGRDTLEKILRSCSARRRRLFARRLPAARTPSACVCSVWCCRGTTSSLRRGCPTTPCRTSSAGRGRRAGRLTAGDGRELPSRGAA